VGELAVVAVLAVGLGVEELAREVTWMQHHQRVTHGVTLGHSSTHIT